MANQTNFNNYIKVIKNNNKSPYKIGEFVEIKDINSFRKTPILNRFIIIGIDCAYGDFFYNLKHVDSPLILHSMRLSNLRLYVDSGE